MLPVNMQIWACLVLKIYVILSANYDPAGEPFGYVRYLLLFLPDVTSTEDTKGELVDYDVRKARNLVTALM
jgi:hypothetical protein